MNHHADDFHERRHGPGQRAADIDHQLTSSVLALTRNFWRRYIVAASVGGGIGSAGMFLLMVFGLKIGGATELASVRGDMLRRDSAARADALRRDTAIEHWRARTDSVTTSNAMRIAHLEVEDQIKMFLLCNIAEQLGARTGGLCPVSAPQPHPRPRPPGATP